MRYPKTPRRNRNRAEDNMIDAIDQLAKFEEWTATVLPALQKDATKMSGPEMRAKYNALLTAKMISMGLRSANPAASIAAIKDTLDRDEGRAVEVKEIKHRLESLPSAELDALLRTKLRDLGNTIDVTPEETEVGIPAERDDE